MPACDDPVSLGCRVAAFNANGGVAGKIAVVQRGICARVAKAIFGQQAGAIAVVMVNNAAAPAAVRRADLQNPMTAILRRDHPVPRCHRHGTNPTSDGSRLVLRDGVSISFTPGAPLYGIASFSSGGPRNGDSVLKPDISAPGSPIISTLSAAAPRGSFRHVDGHAACRRRRGARAAGAPEWKPWARQVGDHQQRRSGRIGGYGTHTAGSGFVNAASAAHTQVTASADDKLTSMSFGLAEFRKDFTKDQKIRLHNDGNANATFNVAAVMPQGSPHTVALDRTQVKVKAHDDADVRVTLNVPAATAGNSDDVPRRRRPHRVHAGVSLRQRRHRSARAVLPRAARVVQRGGEARQAGQGQQPERGDQSDQQGQRDPGNGGLLQLGSRRQGQRQRQEEPDHQSRQRGCAGVTDRPDGPVIVFAVNTEEAWSAPSTREFDVAIDLDGDGVPDYYVVGDRPGTDHDGLLQRADGHGGLRRRINPLFSISSPMRRTTAARSCCPSSRRISGSRPPARGSATR